MQEILQRFKSPVVISAFVILTIRYILPLFDINLSPTDSQEVVDIVTYILLGFAVTNNPTDKGSF